MKITKYDENNDDLPEGLEYSWLDEAYMQHYGTKKPSKGFTGLTTVLRERRADATYITWVKDGDILLDNEDVDGKREIVKKGTLAHKFIDKELIDTYTIKSYPFDDTPPVTRYSTTEQLKVGDRVVTYNSIYPDHYNNRVGVVTDIQGEEPEKYFLVLLDKLGSVPFNFKRKELKKILKPKGESVEKNTELSPWYDITLGGYYPDCKSKIETTGIMDHTKDYSIQAWIKCPSNQELEVKRIQALIEEEIKREDLPQFGASFYCP